MSLPPRFRAVHVLRDWIENGRLSTGQPMPSERVLSEQLGVGRSAVRSALAMLVKDGLLEDADDAGRVRIVRGVRPSTTTASKVLSSTVAVLTPHPEPNAQHSQPGWVEQLVLGTFHGIRSAGMDFLAIHPERLLDGGLEHLITAPPFGVVLPEAVEVRINHGPWLERLHQAGIPVVVYGGSPELLAFDRVTSDHAQGSYELTRWMLAHGRSRVMMCWPTTLDQHYWYAARRAGYERAMREAGLEPQPTLIMPEIPQNQPVTQESFAFETRHHVGFFMDRLTPSLKCDAMLCHTDGAVPYVAAAIHACGKEPGKDVWLAGYDNYAMEMVERQFCPWLPRVTMDKQNWNMGEEMARLLLDRRLGRLPTDPQLRVLPPKLITL